MPTARSDASNCLPPKDSASSSSSPPSTPPRPKPLTLARGHAPAASVGLSSPVYDNAYASPSPALARIKQDYLPASPALTPGPVRGLRRGHSLRAHFRPSQPSISLGLHTETASSASSSTTMIATSRPTSPLPRPASRAARSPTRRDVPPRPPSRCESLLRDTLRRDELEKQRSASRSPSRWSERPKRPRGNSFLGALSGLEDAADGKSDRDEDVDAFAPNSGGSFEFLYRPYLAPTAPRVVRGATTGSPPEAMLSPYGSPSSPSPMPPSMHRTRTAPAVPRASRPSFSEEHRAEKGLPLRAPQSSRPAFPNPVSGGGSSASQSLSQSHTSSSDSSPKSRPHTLSPHEAVLRAKLECVLMKAGPPTPDEKFDLQHPQIAGRVRNHHRSQSHGVTVVTAKRPHDDQASSVSPQVRHGHL